MADSDIYPHYKPLRNHLRQLDVRESFRVLWAYSNHLQLGQDLPKDFDVAKEFLKAKHKVEKGVFEWELETLAYEIITHSQLSSYNPKTMRRWSQFSGAVNKLKDLENSIAGKYSNASNVLYEMFRISHRQFPWQTVPNTVSITRYYKIFSQPAVDKIIHDTTGLTTKELNILGLALLGHYLGKHVCAIPISITIPGYTQEQANLFLERFSLDFEELKTRVVSTQTLDYNYAYNYHLLRQYPLVKIKNGSGPDELFCPLPTLWFWRITGGLYYEVCQAKGFDNAFGKAFEYYVGEVLGKAHTNKQLIIYKAHPYKVGKEAKESVDWIVDEGETAWFVECKTKRMKVGAKFEIIDHTEQEQELGKMADIIVQAYKSINDYRQNLYPHLPYDPQRTVFPVILTLEEWYLFPDPLVKSVDAKVVEKFIELGLPQQWLTDTPYQICAIHDFERLAQVIQTTGLKNFMEKRMQHPERQKWHLGQFAHNEFQKECQQTKFLFEEEFEKLGQP